jgi:hypothetical protein
VLETSPANAKLLQLRFRKVATPRSLYRCCEPMLETRRRLRALVKLIEHKKQTLVYSDFEDRTGAAADVAVPTSQVTEVEL